MTFFTVYLSESKKCNMVYIKEYCLTRKAPRVGANSSSVFAFDMHYK